jgi:hypothetical protein
MITKAPTAQEIIARQERDRDRPETSEGALVPATREQIGAYERYAATGGTFFGDLLKFNGKTGEWTAGPQGLTVSAGTQLVAVVPFMAVGHCKWRDGQLVDERMVPLAPGFDLQEHRTKLDENDRSLWKEEDGRPRDPWSEAAKLPMVNPRTKERYTYSTSSLGGVNCIKALIKTFVQQVRAAPETTAGHLPLVQLGSRPYQHPIRSRGTIFNPTFEGIDWVPAAAVLLSRPAKARQPSRPADDLNDEILF